MSSTCLPTSPARFPTSPMLHWKCNLFAPHSLPGDCTDESWKLAKPSIPPLPAPVSACPFLCLVGLLVAHGEALVTQGLALRSPSQHETSQFETPLLGPQDDPKNRPENWLHLSFLNSCCCSAVIGWLPRHSTHCHVKPSAALPDFEQLPRPQFSKLILDWSSLIGSASATCSQGSSSSTGRLCIAQFWNLLAPVLVARLGTKTGVTAKEFCKERHHK